MRLVARHTELEDRNQGLYFVFDLETIVERLGGFIRIKWISQWYHSVTHGTYLAPDQVVVNFQKILGSSHVVYDKEGYTLDRVSPNVTGFAMRQIIKATQVDAVRVNKNIVEVLSRVRSGAPDWRALPDSP